MNMKKRVKVATDGVPIVELGAELALGEEARDRAELEEVGELVQQEQHDHVREHDIARFCVRAGGSST